MAARGSGSSDELDKMRGTGGRGQGNRQMCSMMRARERGCPNWLAVGGVRSGRSRNDLDRWGVGGRLDGDDGTRLMGSRASVGGGERGESRGTSLRGGVLGFDVMGAFGSFKSLGGGGLGKDEIGL